MILSRYLANIEVPTMPTTPPEISITEFMSIRNTLRILGIPVHRKGYRQLTIAIACFAKDDTQSVTKELYPAVAQIAGIQDWRLVERDIRTVIQYAWANRDSSVWDIYFPGICKAPSNKIFISTLSDLLQ